MWKRSLKAPIRRVDEMEDNLTVRVRGSRSIKNISQTIEI